MSGLSDENSGGAANCAAPLIGESVLIPCGNACLSAEFVNVHCSSSFLVGSGKEFDDFNTFSKSKDACKFFV